jgi:plastocyanin domain-containing protein
VTAVLETISHRLRHGGPPAGGDRALVKTRVRVRGGYEPETVYARAGEPVAIVFRREETASCSERVVFPALGKSAMLPAYEDVTVELTPPGPGEYEFTCQLGLLRGRLVVEEPR